jgi:hypothetical protein
MPEVVVGREHRKVMTKAKLGKEGVDRSSLNACSSAAVSQLGGFSMILAIRREERYCGKAVQNLRASLWTRETLQKLLENEACGQKHLACLDGADKRVHFLGLRRWAAPKRKRPNAGIDQEAQ